jgi:hypothetical protein
MEKEIRKIEKIKEIEESKKLGEECIKRANYSSDDIKKMEEFMSKMRIKEEKEK